jgi:hypothetical protein
VRDEAGRQDAHEAREHHERGRVAVDAGLKLGIEVLAARKTLVRDRLGGQPLCARPDQARCLGLVTEHGGHARAQALLPALLLRRAHDGLHVRARARDQDHDVFHGGAIIPGSASQMPRAMNAAATMTVSR